MVNSCDPVFNVTVLVKKCGTVPVLIMLNVDMVPVMFHVASVMGSQAMSTGRVFLLFYTSFF